MKIEKFMVENVFCQDLDITPSQVVRKIRRIIQSHAPLFDYKVEISEGLYTVRYIIWGDWDSGLDGYDICYNIKNEVRSCGSAGAFYIKVWMDILLHILIVK